MNIHIRVVFLTLLLIPALSIQAQDDIQVQLDDFIAEIAPADGGSRGANNDWRPELAAAGGLVDTDESEAATTDGLFRIASMSKTWLTVVVMQLDEQGVLGLDDAAANWPAG